MLLCRTEAAGEAGACSVERDGVERVEEMKGITNQVKSKQGVNHVLWARQNVGEQDCQDRVDVKALTGRGSQANLRHSLSQLDQLVGRMQQLSEQSKSVAGLAFYLVVHQRAKTGYLFLRWRQRWNQGTNRHLGFDDVEQLASQLPPDLKTWCMEASRVAQQLNSDHLELRSVIKKIRREIERGQQHIFPRSSFPSK